MRNEETRLNRAGTRRAWGEARCREAISFSPVLRAHSLRESPVGPASVFGDFKPHYRETIEAYRACAIRAPEDWRCRIKSRSDDKRFLERVNYVVDQLAECQKANGDGYVAAIPGGKKAYAEVAAGDIRSAGFDLNGVWVPNYTMHKVLAGLRDAYRFCGNQKALEVSRGLADWFEKTLSGLNEEQMQKILAAEHGGMNEVFADLYADTGDERYLKLSRRSRTART